MSWRKTLAAVAVSLGVLLSGCAGGGGGAGTVATLQPPPPQPPPPPPAAPTPAPPMPTAVGFTSWASLSLPGAYDLKGVGLSVPVTFPPPVAGTVSSSEYNLVLNFNGSGDLTDAYRVDGAIVISTAVDSSWPYVSSQTVNFDLGSATLLVKQLSRQDSSDFRQRNFSYADPASTGLSYTTYGWWSTSDFSHPDWFEGFSAGVVTANTAIPVAGSAQFTGALAAFRIGYPSSGPLAAPITIDVDFGARAARFSSTDFRNPGGSILAGTALGGVLTYASRQNTLSGQLTSANFTGPASARFYGPGAEEIGGAFVLRPNTGANNDTIIGGFGARR